MKDYEDLFIKEQLAKSTQEEIKKISKNKKELEKAKNRVIEIDNLFMHIYEDNVSGKISDDRFRNLSFNYDKEQQELKTKIEQLSKDIENTEKKDTDITQFISNVKKYTEIAELTPEILNELIEKIVIHQTQKINGKKVQEIDIYYRGVGIICFGKIFNPLGILTLISKYYGLLYIIEKYRKTIRSQINVDIILL